MGRSTEHRQGDGSDVERTEGPRTRAGGTHHRLGPQRNPDIDAAALQAARELLAERGYNRTSIDAIATRSGVSRPAIYRRWNSKAQLIHDAVYPSVEPGDLPPDDLIGAVSTLVAGAYRLFGAPAARAGVPGLIAETRSDPELHRRLVIDQLDPLREALGRLLDQAASTGAARPGLDADAIIDAIAGAAIFAVCLRDTDDAEQSAKRMTDLLLRGILDHG
ncbi:TetR/AcrR family transcriptional regulator [Tomitella fengzijianii]|uniref:TetR/AcrR family transcriptional regulator n=1 Tax=Tomitella fengzijianii TaxID=2597660 RepID=A0A516X0B8_9ACTN|nr:TetR/AcrR family transcriptional regulator [Tomitella fengzijianii]QDQ96522.1 TetR/AcrR family transcriptional regulator [Tomitella fengzijianii]